MNMIFFNCYLAAPRPLSRGQPHWPKGPEGHREPRSKVGSLSLAKCLVGFKLGTFWFLLQRLNPFIALFLQSAALTETKSISNIVYILSGVSSVMDFNGKKTTTTKNNRIYITRFLF